MKLKNMVLGTLLSTLSFTSLAAVTIQVPDTIDLLAANEAKPDISGGFFSSSNTVTLPDGENQIVFRYKSYFSQGNDRIVVESDAIIATFKTSDSELNFELPDYQNQQQAQEHMDNLQWQLVDQSGAAVEVNQDKLIKKGVQLGRDYPSEAKAYNTKGGIAALSIGQSQPSVATNQTPADTTNNAEEMLHFWYQRADAETKAKFKTFVNQQ